MKKSLLIALASALVAGAAIHASPAFGQETPVSRSVRTADLDLSLPEGRRTLEHRLTLAVSDVCGAASLIDLEGRNAVRECRATTAARARAEIDRRVAASDRSPVVVAAR